MRSFEFKLTEPIKISVSGDFVEADTIVCHSPSAKRKKICYRLRQKFVRIAMNMPDSRTAEEKAESEAKAAADDREKLMTAQEIEQLIFMGEDAESFTDDFEKLITVPGVAKISEQDLTLAHIEKINDEDFARLVGEYIENFFISYWIPRGN